MKKNILFLILFVFPITIKSSSNEGVGSIKSFSAGLYVQERADKRSLSERLKSLKDPMDFSDVTLVLLNPKDESLSQSDFDKSIQLLELKKDQSRIVLRATLIDNKQMDKEISGLLSAFFSPEKSFMSCLEQQAKNGNVYFKISGLYGGSDVYMPFYFSVPSKDIISSFELPKPEKLVTAERKIHSTSWVKYTIPFGLLAILSILYFKYKN